MTDATVVIKDFPTQAVKNDPDELLTGDELCAKLKIKKSFLYSPARRKGPDPIPAILIGKYLRYRLPDVIAWIERNQARD